MVLFFFDFHNLFNFFHQQGHLYYLIFNIFLKLIPLWDIFYPLIYSAFFISGHPCHAPLEDRNNSIRRALFNLRLFYLYFYCFLLFLVFFKVGIQKYFHLLAMLEFSMVTNSCDKNL